MFGLILHFQNQRAQTINSFTERGAPNACNTTNFLHADAILISKSVVLPEANLRVCVVRLVVGEGLFLNF